MEKKLIERQEVMGAAGSLEKEMEEFKNISLNKADSDILVTPKFTPLFTILCC